MKPLRFLLPLLCALPAFAYEPAVVLPIGALHREAIYFRAQNGQGLAGFLPAVQNGWRLQLLPAAGAVALFSAADFDGDGNADLLIIRDDGGYAIWPGDGEGGFTLKGDSQGQLRDFTPVAARTRQRGGGLPPDLELVDAAGRRLELVNDRFGRFTIVSVAAAADEPASARTVQVEVLSADFTGSGHSDQVEILRDRLRVLPAAGGHALELLSPWLIRTAAAGDFDGDGQPDLAVVSHGERPALRLFLNRRENFAPAGQLLQFIPAGSDFAPAAPEIISATIIVSTCGNTFCPSDVSIYVDDVVIWTNLGLFHTVEQTNGNTCTATSGGFTSGSAPVAVGTYSNAFPAAGGFKYKDRAFCLAGMKGRVNVAVRVSPGTVPSAGTPLRVAKSGDNLALTWGAACNPAATAYEIYEGEIGVWYSHLPMAGKCDIPVTSDTVTPVAGNSYYLIVPHANSQEGSYGTSSSGMQIPPPAVGACLPQNLNASC